MCVALSPCGFFDSSAGCATCGSFSPHVSFMATPQFISHARHFGSHEGRHRIMRRLAHLCSTPLLHVSMVLNAQRSTNAREERWLARPGCGGARGRVFATLAGTHSPYSGRSLPQQKNDESYHSPSIVHDAQTEEIYFPGPDCAQSALQDRSEMPKQKYVQLWTALRLLLSQGARGEETKL